MVRPTEIRRGRAGTKLSLDQQAAKAALLRQEGWSVPQIARELGNTERTVYRLLDRARTLGAGPVSDFKLYADLSDTARSRIEFSPEGFERFFNAYAGYKNWPGTDSSLAPIHQQWVHDALSAPRLLVNCPPRHAKSEIFSVWFPLWLISGSHATLASPGDPDSFGLRNVQILLVSQTDKLVKKFTNKIAWHLSNNRKLIEDFGRFRPEGGDWPWRPNTGELMVESRSRDTESGDLTIQVRGSGQAILGFEANWVICDDPVDRSGEADRLRLSEWFHGDVMTRLEPGGRAVVIGQRLHVHDLYGELASEGGWHHINYQAVLDREKKQVLWPEKWTFEAIETVRNDIGQRMFDSMYQQNPLAADARLALDEWLYGDDEHPGCADRQRIIGYGLRDYEPDGVVRVVSLDPSPTRFAGLVVADVDRSVEHFNATIIEIVRDRMAVRDMIDQLERVWATYQPEYLIFEQNAAQRWLLQDRSMDALRQKMVVLPHNTGRNKGDPVLGVESLSNDFEMGRLSFPFGDAESRAMTELLYEEAKTYPQGKTDDLLMALWFIKFNFIRLAPRIHDGETRRRRSIPPRLAGGWKWWQQTHASPQKPPPGASFTNIEREEEWRN